MRLATITQTRRALPFDLQKLLATRLLIQANSGGGKSYAIRKLLEETHGKVQQIILDLEGEFSTLREKFDYVLAGRGENVDVQIDLKSAPLLARKVLELQASTIIDLSELKKHERTLFVKRFLDSLLEAPKKLWHSVLVIVDEAHHFCPESKSGKAESTGSVIDLQTRGRKRGLCGVLATQRPSKLNKDASAECNNKMVGRCSQDIDMKRSGDELGFTKKEDVRTLRQLEAGEFFCFGPSFTNEIIKVKIDKVITSHPDLNRKIGFSNTPPTPKIKAMLSKLVDLPQKAEEELREKKDYLSKIRSLQAELRRKPKDGKIIEKKVIDERAVERARKIGFNEALKQSNQQIIQLNRLNKAQRMAMEKIARVLKSFADITVPVIKPIAQAQQIPSAAQSWSRQQKKELAETYKDLTTESTSLPPGAKRMLNSAASYHPNPITRHRLAFLSNINPKGGSFTAYLSKLRRAGLIEDVNDGVIATDQGMDEAGEVKPIPSGEELISFWIGKLPPGAGRMLRAVINAYPNSITRQELAEESGILHSGGSFTAYLSKLRRNGLIVDIGRDVKVSNDLME